MIDLLLKNKINQSLHSITYSFIYLFISEIKGSTKRGRPLGRWKDRVKEYMGEIGTSRGGRD